ncbi:CRTAC1 family protein [Aliifodinibius sp. S!AR15-10]|uniref:CRTAC1 family protein n=1 Tax=Aliifodinibius sp. S!AR15-10 TaxID=2950437 RepID=UPI0028573A09|nr:CRTAC1 family protein [Aliifodinibius sp. S!AR15-10]MDR8390167.1 CRTAC1 family protein [Aliifodinibius sp. S!AR15-10]
MSNYFYYFSILIGLVSLITISACSNDTRLQDGTRAMVARLDSIEQNINPQANEYANNARLEYYKKVPPRFRIDKQINYHHSFAQELLRAGQTEKAIERFNVVLELLDKLEPKQQEESASFRTQVEESIALSYLRLGEQQNCLLNHSASSCLFPIKGQGIHTITEGSEKAIQKYQQILRKRGSDDMISRWLLNIAYMTLGKHPYEVPQQWLVPAEAFESDYDIKKFPEIAMSIGLAENGLSGGSITEDFNNDGFIDVVASSWGLDDQVHYFENNGNGSFIKKTKEAGITGIEGGLNLRHADFNNDGFADIFVLRGAWLQEAGKHPNSLLQNNGDGTFSDVTESAGLLSFHPTQTAEWADFNNDGWLDLFIGNESTKSAINPTELYLNQRDGTFKNVAEQAGVDIAGYFKGISVGDYNNDGLQDLYLSRLDGPNILFKNDGLNEQNIPVFTDMTKNAGVAEPLTSFPTWFWDYNNDGWLDLFVSAYYATPGDIAREYLGLQTEAEMPRLYRNNGDGTFTNVAPETGLNKVLYTMGSNFGDLDNDGWLDFYVGTGDPDFRSIMPNRMFRNNEGKQFQEVTGSGGFGHLQKGHGVSFADLDNDGDQDIFTVIGGAFEGDLYMNALFENPGHQNNWITLSFNGEESNRMGIGNRISVEVETPTGTRTIHNTVTTGSSFGSNVLRQEIGLGDAEKIIRIEVQWPTSGKTQVFKNVEMNRFYRISEIEEQIVPLDQKKIQLGRNNTSTAHSH